MKKITISLSVIAGAVFWGCDPGIDKIVASDPNTCEGCHIDQTALQKYASEESATASGGG